VELIEKVKRESRVKHKGVYYENHHVIPRSLGGTNDKDNLVLLTAKEHFVAHLLLAAFTVGKDKSKMSRAVWRMVNTKKGKVSAKKYDELRKNMSSWNKGKKMSKEYCEKARISHLGKEPWNKGKTNTISEKTRLKLSEAKKGKSSWNKGISPSQETKDKIRKSLLELNKINEKK
jgi:hypothetical protein